MNLLRFSPAILTALPLVMSVACTSIPHDAPHEFMEAGQAINVAEKSKADKTFPHTVDKAEKSFKDSLALLEHSRLRHLPESERNAAQASAIAKANEAKRLAEQAVELRNQVRSWDQDLEGYSLNKQTAEDLKAVKDQLALLNKQTENNALASFQHRNEAFQFSGPIAYFETDKTTLANRYNPHLDQIAKLLKSEDGLSVKIVGYADPRGSESHNDDLAARRAEAVARELENRGVSKLQILVESKGDHTAPKNLSNSAKLQLERRVEVEIGSHPTSSSVMPSH